MLFPRFCLSVLSVCTAIIGSTNAITATGAQEVLTALQTVQGDVQSYGAIINRNLPYTSILKPNATATAEIQAAFSSIDAALEQALASIQTVQKRQASDPSTAVILEIEQVLQTVVGDILALILTAGDNLTTSVFFTDIVNPLLSALSDFNDELESLLDNIPGFAVFLALIRSQINSLPI